MSQRYKTKIPAEFRAGSLRGSGHIRNVGTEGLFVGTASLPAQGDSVHVQFRSPAGDPVKVTGLVWWTTQGQRSPSQGFGIRLLEETESYRALVRNLG